MDVDHPAAMEAYYALDKERDRLAAGVGRIEYLRTVEVVSRTLPQPPAVVADIGGGPGRYTDWLVGEGYTVFHRDVVAQHVDQVRDRYGESVDSAVADACDLDLDDASVDVVLLLGPLYHLPDPADRAAALGEAGRVVRPGGMVHAAAISRWAARLHGIVVERLDLDHPGVLDQVDAVESTGVLLPVTEGGFTGYTHTPDELRREVGAAGLTLDSLVMLEGLAMTLTDLDERLDDPASRAVLLDMLRATESVPDLCGLGPHLLASARRPD